MTYYADFSLYDYDFRAEPAGLTIAWLEDGYNYPVDEVSAEDLATIIELGLHPLRPPTLHPPRRSRRT